MARYNPNKVKIHRSYCFMELAGIYDVHKNTIAAWVKDGLPCLKDKRPFLILGKDIRHYLQQRRDRQRKQCAPDELYCMRCRSPTKPAENFVELEVISSTKGRITGFCTRCESIINKFIGTASLETYIQIFDLALPMGMEHIRESNKALVNSDFHQREKP
jgi:hypothetical protein